VTRRAKDTTATDAEADVTTSGEELKPIRVVERELTRPDGTKVRVEVPVYPPFQLRERPPPKPERARGRRKPPSD
jgi:hypothetical protein